ncbi:MAG TPA: Ig-like domain-containing protein, partial [Gemmatimonadales bacterium]|nr:Ig-like domain-containing protein [Gemmatimonadales bacterium]
MRIGAGFALALLIVTCTDKDVTGPLKRTTATFDVRALASPGLPGEPDIPLDSIRVTFQDPATSTPALDSVIHTRGDTIAGDSLVLKLAVELLHNDESFILTIQTYGANVVYYKAVDTLSLSIGVDPHPALLAKYVGPGANAMSVQIAPRDTTVVGGQPMTMRATVLDSSEALIAGVPVGYRLSDSTRGVINHGSAIPTTFTGATNVRDSVWIVGETPTHLRDSTWIHIIPPPTQLLKVAGDSQGGTPSIILSTPLTVQVKDALGAPFAGETVTWAVALGGANLSATTTQTDTGGHASITVTPTATGTLHVTASAAGLAGSPITFTATISSVAPANIAIVGGNSQTDTVGKTLPVQLAVKVTNASFAPLANVQVAWSALIGGGVATPDTSITDTAGVARTTFRLGGTSGLQSVRALVAGTGVSINFSLTGVAGAARRIAIVSGNNQNDTANRTLPLPLVVVTRDTFNNPVIGARVAWSAITGGGTATPDTSTSDTAGHAQTAYKLGLAIGADSIRALLVGDTAHVTFVATAVSGAISQVIIAPKVDTLPKGDSLQYTATLKDSAGNVTSGTVAWSSTNPTVATVTAGGMAHLLAGGTASIVASAGGHADTAALSVRALTSIAISPSDTVVTAVGDSLLLAAHGVDNFGGTVGGLVIRFISASPSIASVNAITGRVHISGAGNAVLLAKDS